MATTTNFGWETPDDTDLVKDGALAMRTLGNAIDSSMVDLKGGTTGQVLSKNSNTDMDFTWVTSDDANAIQNAIVDAKGDLIAASAADTPARLAVGNDGETLVADSSATTGLRWQGNFSAGKNKIINGDFGIWQRGTSFSGNSFNADRWYADSDATLTTSQQSFTAGTAPVSGYEGTFFIRYAKSAGGTYLAPRQRIEDVRTFAGQTVTLSFWAKANATVTIAPYYQQLFGTGGSATVGAQIATQSITTSWSRYSFTFAVPSISGKTLGSGNCLEIFTGRYTGSGATTIDIWGVQLEAGNTATAFQTATGTLAGEAAVCDRYFQRFVNSGNMPAIQGGFYSTSAAWVSAQTKVPMRVAPSLTIQAGTYKIATAGIGDSTTTSATAATVGSNGFSFLFTNLSPTRTARDHCYADDVDIRLDAEL